LFHTVEPNHYFQYSGRSQARTFVSVFNFKLPGSLYPSSINLIPLLQLVAGRLLVMSSSSFPYSTPSIRILHPPTSPLAAVGNAVATATAATATVQLQHANDNKYHNSAIRPGFSSSSSSPLAFGPSSSSSELRISPAIPMPIRDSPSQQVPPPLPPPRHIAELSRGVDMGWHFANRIRSDESCGYRPYTNSPPRSPDSRDSRSGNDLDETDSNERQEDTRPGFPG
jgi:hypothetical protein